MPDLQPTLTLLETLITRLDYNLALVRRHPHLYAAQLADGIIAEREAALASYREAHDILENHANDH